MTTAPQFIVTFRGIEIGRYETAESAMAAARSVIDTELGVQKGGAVGPLPADLPSIEWQPPRVPFPFDANGYWHRRAQTLTAEQPSVPPPVHLPPPPRPVLPRTRDEHMLAPPEPVYGGPPPFDQPESGRRRWFGKGHD